MESKTARALFDKFAGTLAFVAVEDSEGTAGIGSAFHVGEGVFVTARHVVEGMNIVEVCMTHRTCIALEGNEAKTATNYLHGPEGESIRVHHIGRQALRIKMGPFFHKEPSVDVAVFQVDGIDPRTPFVELGGHLDDWLGEGDFVLTEAIVLGYPPIPQTNDPHLVVARSEINAVVDVRHAPHVHFILSATPRGGFSGGLAVLDGGVALGVITSSLVANSAAAELGFFAVLTVEPIYVCLAEHKLLPDCQTDIWEDFWNTDTLLEFCAPTETDAAEVRVLAEVDVFDNGKRVYLKLRCNDQALLDRATEAARVAVQKFTPIISSEGRSRLISISEYTTEISRHFVADAEAAIVREMIACGLTLVPEGTVIKSYNS